MERKQTLTETLTKENENLYRANQVALYTDYNTSREMIYKVCAFNRTLIDTISNLETRIKELENKFEPEKEDIPFEIFSRKTEDNWVMLGAFANGCEYKIEAKVFREPNEKYGLPESEYRISKFFVKDKTNNKTIVMSDRGYLVGEENLKEPLIKAFIKEVLDYSDKEFERYMITIED